MTYTNNEIKAYVSTDAVYDASISANILATFKFNIITGQGYYGNYITLFLSHVIEITETNTKYKHSRHDSISATSTDDAIRIFIL